MTLKPAFGSATKEEEIHHTTSVFNTCYRSMLQIIQIRVVIKIGL